MGYLAPSVFLFNASWQRSWSTFESGHHQVGTSTTAIGPWVWLPSWFIQILSTYDVYATRCWWNMRHVHPLFPNVTYIFLDDQFWHVSNPRRGGAHRAWVEFHQFGHRDVRQPLLGGATLHRGQENAVGSGGATVAGMDLGKGVRATCEMWDQFPTHTHRDNYINIYTYICYTWFLHHRSAMHVRRWSLVRRKTTCGTFLSSDTSPESSPISGLWSEVSLSWLDNFTQSRDFWRATYPTSIKSNCVFGCLRMFAKPLFGRWLTSVVVAKPHLGWLSFCFDSFSLHFGLLDTSLIKALFWLSTLTWFSMFVC